MNQQQISQILREYEKNRHFAELKRQADLDRAMTFSEFSALQRGYNDLVTSLSDDAADEKMSEIRKKQTEVLKRLGIDNFFEMQYACARCKDTGYDGGKLCPCVKKKFAADQKNSLVPAGARFENCDLTLFDESIRKQISNAYSFAKKYVDEFPPKNKLNIFISGGIGAGKTYLTSCIFNALTEKGVFAEYLTAFNLNNLFLKSHLAPLNEKNEILDVLFSADLLIVDDLGTEPLYKNVTEEYLFNLVNERTINAKSTVISTNLSPDQILERYGERILSRICNKNNSRLINLPGKDLRLKK
jgi:DNA replication protein DnaC